MKIKCKKCNKEFEWVPKRGRQPTFCSVECRIKNYKKKKIKSDREYSRKYREEHPKWKEENNKKYKVPRNELVKKYHKDYPERIKAVRSANQYIKRHNIKRQPCENCGELKNTLAHHPDYSKRFEIVWLCPKCHKRLHAGIIDFDEQKHIVDLKAGVAPLQLKQKESWKEKKQKIVQSAERG